MKDLGLLDYDLWIQLILLTKFSLNQLGWEPKHNLMMEHFIFHLIKIFVPLHSMPLINIHYLYIIWKIQNR